MKAMKIYLYIIATTFIVVSCTSEKSKWEIVQEKKNLMIGSLVPKYNIHYMLDTIDKQYTIDYYPIIESKYQLIKEYSINDIYQRDSVLYVSINPLGSIKTLILPISKDQMEIIRKKDATNNILVVGLNEVKKIKFAFEVSYPESDEEGNMEGDFDVSLENSGSFYAKGELIEIASPK